MRTTCPKCKTVFSEGSAKGGEESAVLICPKCGNLVLIGTEFDQASEASLDEQAKLASGAVSVDAHLYRRRLKRYFVLLMILLACVVAYQISNMWRNESALNATRNTAARAALKRLATAQEAYYADHQTYCNSLDELKTSLSTKKHIQIDILWADDQAWAGTAYHSLSPLGFTFDSGNGGFQSEGFTRHQAEAR
jgi:uncharacterized Zn finger protein (UPF0148 family)